MNFPNLAFFYKLPIFYKKLKTGFLLDYYKFHGIIYCNLYMRIYRLRLIKLGSKKVSGKNIQAKKDLFIDKTRRKRNFIRRNNRPMVNKQQIRNYNTNIILLVNKKPPLTSSKIESKEANLLSNNVKKIKKNNKNRGIMTVKITPRGVIIERFGVPHLTHVNSKIKAAIREAILRKNCKNKYDYKDRYVGGSVGLKLTIPEKKKKVNKEQEIDPIFKTDVELRLEEIKEICKNNRNLSYQDRLKFIEYIESVRPNKKLISRLRFRNARKKALRNGNLQELKYLDKAYNKLKKLEKKKKKTRISPSKKLVTNKMVINVKGKQKNTNKSSKSKKVVKRWKRRRPRPYIFYNKFKNCGNRYDFDPFYLYTTHKLKEFNYARTRRTVKKKPVISKTKFISLRTFDKRLGKIKFKYFNTYVYKLIKEIYSNPSTNKQLYIRTLKKKIHFLFYFLRYLRNRLTIIKNILLVLNKRLLSYTHRLDSMTPLLLEISENDILLSYLKKKNEWFFILYSKIISSFVTCSDKYNNLLDLDVEFRTQYTSLLVSFKRIYNSRKKTLSKFFKQKNLLRNRIATVRKYEKLHRNVVLLSKKMKWYKFSKKKLSKWKHNPSSSVYIHINKYLTLFRSLLLSRDLKSHTKDSAIIYIKATATNVFLYFIFNNKLLFKKSCGELTDIKKKDRRFWRNVFPLVESLLPLLVKTKLKYRFPVVSLYINGSFSLCSPLITRLRKHNRKFRRMLKFLNKENSFFWKKTDSVLKKFGGRYILFPIYRLKLYAIYDGFNKLSKILFAINKIKDITSWPYNGCVHKKINVR